MPPSPILPTEEVVKKRTPGDFVFGKVIGEGSFSTVYLSKDIHTNKEYAIKVLEKRHVKREKKTEYVTREKNVLQMLSACSNYFVKLYCTFQDNERLYFVLTYAKYGELLSYLKTKNFNMNCTKYYTAEIILALEILHSKGIIHRDLKPENILFDENWHILITDFGSAKIISPSNTDENNEDESNIRRKKSFVGTPEYVSPELLNENYSCFASDLWALGCIVFQMLAGATPFRAGNEYLTFQKIIKLEYEFPEGFDKNAKNFIEKLLVLSPDNRLGANDVKPYQSLRRHGFLNDIDFENLGPPPKFSCAEDVVDAIIPDYLEPGLDGQKVSQLHLAMICPTTLAQTSRKSSVTSNIMVMESDEIERRLVQQKKEQWNDLVEGNLILKKGLIDKRKGLFPRRRMFLLTMGPHLYYVDPTTMVLKGEIPWSPDLKTEAKNFKTFMVHTPNRTYYLEEPDGFALEWCKALDEVKAHYYPTNS